MRRATPGADPGRCLRLGLGSAGKRFAGRLGVTLVDEDPRPASGCEQVQTSHWAKLEGIPVATLGLAGYVAILASLLVRGELGRLAGACLALAGFGFSVYLTYVEVFKIRAICPWCVSSALILAALAVLTVARWLVAPGAGTKRAGLEPPRQAAAPPT